MPWDDLWSNFVIAGLSVLFGVTAYRQGRASYRVLLYLAAGNAVLSVLLFLADAGVGPDGGLLILYALALTVLPFFATIGAMSVFARPKHVECFRCRNVGWPQESDEAPTPFDNTEHQAFRKLHYEFERRRQAAAAPHDDGPSA